MITWLSENIVEVFGAVTGIGYVILEIRRNILLWPLGILTSAVYIYVFGRNGFYAGMVLQAYYVAISIYGWYKWHADERREEPNRSGARRSQIQLSRSARGSEQGEGGSELRAQGSESEVKSDVSKIDCKTALICLLTALVLWALLWFSLDRWTDSPVPLWDGLITSLSVVATWMLTRKYIEQWYVWIVANTIAVVVYLAVGMYPTAVLFFVYFVMAIIGLRAWSLSYRLTNEKAGVETGTYTL
jgi:nicotinamide mononucleotide transporter